MHHRGREQLRRRPPPAAETGSRSRGSGRRGGGPLKGRTPMRAPQPVQCPPSAPAGKKAPAELCGSVLTGRGHCAGLHHFFSALYQCAGGRCGEQCHHGGVVVCRHPGVQPSGAGRGSQGLRRDRQGDHGAVRVLLFVDFLWYNCVTRRWLVCLRSFPSVI